MVDNNEAPHVFHPALCTLFMYQSVFITPFVRADQTVQTAVGHMVQAFLTCILSHLNILFQSSWAVLFQFPL